MEEVLEKNKSAILVFVERDGGVFIEHFILYETEDPSDQLICVATELFVDESLGLAGRNDLQFTTFKAGDEYDMFKNIILEMKGKD